MHYGLGDAQVNILVRSVFSGVCNDYINILVTGAIFSGSVSGCCDV